MAHIVNRTANAFWKSLVITKRCTCRTTVAYFSAIIGTSGNNQTITCISDRPLGVLGTKQCPLRWATLLQLFGHLEKINQFMV